MITIKDVAKLAEVNISTVSKVFNNYGGISDATKERIFKAAKELGYIPSKSAAELSRGVQPYLGLIINNLNTNSAKDEYIFRIVSGVQERSSELEMDLTLFTTTQIKKKDYSYVDFCKHHRLLGAIVHGLDINDPYLTELLESPLPCVLIDIEHESSTAAFISTDNVQAAKDVVRLMHSKGIRKLCHILGSPNADVTMRRKEGFLKAVGCLGLAPEDVIIISGEFNEHTAYVNMKKTLEAHRDIQGVFASSDLMALGAMRAIKEAGLKIGKDIALVGFDGLTALEYTSPSIATVRQDFHNMGRMAVDTLISISKGEKFKGRNYVPYELLERESV
ncbi:MAG: LacI family transcriptional regulator [Firmicutes bacterium]|nr:LacI family transcriptional regulator [Bacillota bacterium]